MLWFPKVAFSSVSMDTCGLILVAPVRNDGIFVKSDYCQIRTDGLFEKDGCQYTKSLKSFVEIARKLRLAIL